MKTWKALYVVFAAVTVVVALLASAYAVLAGRWDIATYCMVMAIFFSQEVNNT